MILTGWRGNKHSETGAGYGLKLAIEDRDRFFDMSWKTVLLKLPFNGGSKTVEINIDKPSFWNRTCRELIHKEIGLWLIEQGAAPWPQRKPPRVEVLPSTGRCFKVTHITNKP